MKLQPTPWYLPSASRHLLDRDAEFFKSKPIRDVSAWLRRVQYGVQEIEMTEQRNSSDIRTFTRTTTTGIEQPASRRRRKSQPVYKTKFVVNKTKQTSLTLVRQTESQLQCPENGTIGLNTASDVQNVARMIFCTTMTTTILLYFLLC